MTPLLRCCGAFGLLLLLGSLSARGDEAKELRWRFQKGQVLKYLFKHREVRITELGDQMLTTTTETEYDVQWTVRDVDDKGTATLDLKLTGVRVTSTGKDFEFQYDSGRGNSSDEDYKKKLIRLFDQLRFADYELQMQPTGRLVRLGGFDKLLREIAPEQNIADFYGLNLRDATFSWYLQQALGLVPAGVAKTGKWEVPVEAKLTDFGNLTGRTQYLLGEPVKVGETACQAVKVQGTQTLDVDMKWLGARLRGVLKTTKLEGKLLFDAKAGRLQGSEHRIDLNGDFKFGAGDNPGSMKVAFEHTLELTLKP